MTIVPNILLRRIYKKNSLRNINEGVAFELKNVIGPGIITRINSVKVNNQEFKPNNIKLTTTDTSIQADKVNEESPLFCKFNQVVTISLTGPRCILPGENTLFIEIISREAGLIQVKFSDNL